MCVLAVHSFVVCSQHDGALHEGLDIVSWSVSWDFDIFFGAVTTRCPGHNFFLTRGWWFSAAG